MTINCTKWRELASDYIEGTLPAEMQRAVTIHLNACPACRQDEAALRAICREINVLPEVDPPMFFRDNLIARIEREKGNRPVGAWWQTLLPNVGRTAVGTALAGGLVAAVIFSATHSPQESHSGPKQQVAAQPIQSLLPGGASASSPVLTMTPQFRIARMMTVLPGGETAYDFSFWLENAGGGTANFQMAGDERKYRFNLNGSTPQTLRVPQNIIGEQSLVELGVNWTADGQKHQRYLFVPVATEQNASREKKQSFGLPEYSLKDVAREIAIRYGQPVTLDDVPETLALRLTARDEEAEETLRRHLREHHLTVTAESGGLLVHSDTAIPRP